MPLNNMQTSANQRVVTRLSTVETKQMWTSTGPDRTASKDSLLNACAGGGYTPVTDGGE